MRPLVEKTAIGWIIHYHLNFWHLVADFLARARINDKIETSFGNEKCLMDLVKSTNCAGTFANCSEILGKAQVSPKLQQFL